MYYNSVIIDGSNLAYKSFSIHRRFSVDIGERIVYTGLTYGFINSLITLKNEFLDEESHIFVAWDRGHEFRSKIYPEYKTLRSEAKEDDKDYLEYKEQLKLLHYVLPILGVSQVYKKGCEADDIVGTLANNRVKHYSENVLLFSSDHDFYQLIDENIHLYAHKSNENKTLYTPEKFEKKFGITPEQYYYVMCLTGCQGDEVPGIKGIGEKTGIKIIQNNPDLILDILKGEFKADKFKGSKKELEKIESNLEVVKLTSKLVKIYTDLDKLMFNRGRKDLDKLQSIFEMLHFNSLLTSKNWNVIKEL